MVKPVYKFFKKESENKYVCLINSCNQPIAGGSHSAFNLERHVKRCHPEKEANLKHKQTDDTAAPSAKTSRITDFYDCSVRPTTVSLAIDEKTLMNACVEMVTKNGRPFALINDSGFRKIIDPILKALKSNVAITPDSVQLKVQSLANSIKSQISSEIKNKLISLKIDSATRFDRSILGINIQYIKNKSICIKTLAMKELKQSHTGEYIKTITLSVLNEFGITPEQVYSITTDNGANMLKAVQLFNPDQTNLIDIDDEIEIENLVTDTHSLDDNSSVDWDGEIVAIDAECDDIIFPECNIGNVNSVRCAVHTLQLAVYKFYKFRNINVKIAKCRQLATKIRTPTIMLLIKALRMKHPILDTTTRWNSTIGMFERLLELRPFCDNNASTHKVLFVPEPIWEFMKSFVNIMQPVKEATVRLQTAHLVVGDFMGIWLKMKLQLSAMNEYMANDILACIQEREELLFKQPAVVSALYLDPRFKSILKPEAISIAKQSLLETWRKIQFVKSARIDTIDNDDIVVASHNLVS